LPALSEEQSLPERAPEVGELVQVRSRRWLVEEVVPPANAGASALISLACADDDAQGQSLEVFWNYELDRGGSKPIAARSCQPSSSRIRRLLT
jgi:hypothetical protein